MDAFDRTRLVGLGLISRITARRWARSAPRAPRWAELLSRILRGDLTPVHPAWRHWGISARGELVSPEGWIFRPGEILAARLRWGRIAGTEWTDWRFSSAALEALPAAANEPWPAAPRNPRHPSHQVGSSSPSSPYSSASAPHAIACSIASNRASCSSASKSTGAVARTGELPGTL